MLEVRLKGRDGWCDIVAKGEAHEAFSNGGTARVNVPCKRSVCFAGKTQWLLSVQSDVSAQMFGTELQVTYEFQYSPR
jgi:hypothetical protein